MLRHRFRARLWQSSPYSKIRPKGHCRSPQKVSERFAKWPLSPRAGAQCTKLIDRNQPFSALADAVSVLNIAIKVRSSFYVSGASNPLMRSIAKPVIT